MNYEQQQINTSDLRFFLYARKSTETDDRQVQSIEDQIKNMRDIAGQLGLKIRATFKEQKTGRKPGVRPIFTEMLNRIEKGEADAILCWQIDRLSRNPIDSGRLGWMLQQGVIKFIKTATREYKPEDNVIVLSVDSGMANEFSRDLSIKVRRGIRGKLSRGGWPGVAPIGYLNRLEDHTIIPDPARFPLIRRAWDLYLTGAYTVPTILKKLNNDWGFRTVRRKRSGDHPIAISGMYKLFTNPFYKGRILHEGKEYPGNHEPMVNATEFDRAAVLLGRNNFSRTRKHNFAFTGFIRCGECGCLITAQKKHKVIKSSGEMRFYTYYGCTRKKTTVDCSQKSALREEVLESQILKLLGKITILPQFRDWALEALRQSNDAEVDQRNKILQSQQQDLSSARKELDTLVDIRIKNLLDDQVYSEKREVLQEKISKLQQAIAQTDIRAEQWLNTTEQVFHFATNARQNFLNGTPEMKKSILMALGQNPRLTNGIIEIQANKWLQPIIDEYPALERTYRTSEPKKKTVTAGRNGDLQTVISSWRGKKDSNPR